MYCSGDRWAAPVIQRASTSTAPPAGCWPFVARGEQLDTLADVVLEGETDIVHLVGPSGVGKSRLATALLEWAERDGAAVARVRASRGTALVPLAALTALLPADVLASPPTVLVAAAVDHVRDLGDGSRVVVLVDDVDLLDAASLAVLTQLVEERLVLLVTTARDGAPAPELLLAATRRGRLRQVRVRPLDRADVATLLHLALEGSVSAPLEQALWELSDGNPLYLRELVHAARESGALRRVDGVWTLASPITTPGSLRDLVADRFGDLEPAARAGLELLALCSVVALEDLEDATGEGVVEELEAAGLVEVEALGDGLQARLAHPIYAQVLRETVPLLRARRLLLAQVDRLESRGAAQHGDVLRLARWRLEANGTADPALLLQAARLARTGHDYAEIERLCRAALAFGPDAEVSALLAEALHEGGRFAEADDAWAEAVREAPADRVAQFALNRALNMFFGLGRLDAALAGLTEAAARADQVGAAEVHAAQALLLTQCGRTKQAAEVLGGAVPDVASEIATRARSLVLLRTGRLSEATALGQVAWDRAPDIGPRLHPSGSLMVVALARLAWGDLPAAAAAATAGAEAASRQGVEFQALWLRWVAALVDLAEGRVGAASARSTEVLATATTSGFSGPARLAAATALTASAQLGAANDAQALAVRLDELDGPRELYASWTEGALGWAEVVVGNRDAAVARWRSTAETYVEHGEVLGAADVLHEAVRLGDRAAADRFLSLAADIEGPLTEARALQARGTAHDDPVALATAADRFAKLGLHLLAAEAATTAVASGALDRRERSRVAALGAAELARCPGAATPALVAAPARGGLTAREQQVARLAAGGRSSKEIAETLVLSVRTVDNHLQNAYAKLGVSSRDQLTAALARHAATATEERAP